MAGRSLWLPSKLLSRHLQQRPVLSVGTRGNQPMQALKNGEPASPQAFLMGGVRERGDGSHSPLPAVGHDKAARLGASCSADFGTLGVHPVRIPGRSRFAIGRRRHPRGSLAWAYTAGSGTLQHRPPRRVAAIPNTLNGGAAKSNVTSYHRNLGHQQHQAFQVSSLLGYEYNVTGDVSCRPSGSSFLVVSVPLRHPYGVP